MLYHKNFQRPVSPEVREERKWADINQKKEDSIFWAGAMDKATMIVVAKYIALSDEELLEKLRFFRDEIYSLYTMRQNNEQM